MKAIFLMMAGIATHGAGLAQVLPALSNPAAIYDGKSFTLPELQNPKDAYTLIVNTGNGAKPTAIVLPPGANGIVISRGALPSSQWSWDYKTTHVDLPKLEIGDTARLVLDRTELRDGTVPFRWRDVDDAAKYRIATQTRPYGGSDEDWETEQEAVCKRLYCVRKETGFYNFPLNSGTEVRWTVTALDADDIPVAQSGRQEVAVRPSWVSEIKKSGFSLQRSNTLSKETAQLPALFSYAESEPEGKGASTAYQAEFALKWDAPGDVNGYSFAASVEARLTSSGESKNSDARIWRAGVHKFFDIGTDSGIELVANLKHEAARKQHTEKGMVEINVVPVFGWLARDHAIGDGVRDVDGNYKVLPWAFLTPIVQFGTDIGKTFDAGTSGEQGKSIRRYRVNARVELDVNALARTLAANGVLLYADATIWRSVHEDGRKTFRVGSAGISFGINEEISIDLVHSVGRQPPEFDFLRETKLGVGVKF